MTASEQLAAIRERVARLIENVPPVAKVAAPVMVAEARRIAADLEKLQQAIDNP